MTHPTEEQLQAWLDGESASLAGDDAVAAHVEQCARCAQWLEGAEQVGVAMRVWADEAVPAPIADLADLVLRKAGATVADRARVVPIASARRAGPWLRIGLPAAAVLAAAAAMLIALRRPELQPGAGHAVMAGLEAHGSEVISVESDGTAHNDVSVMELAGEHAGSTIAVVWIADDEPKPAHDAGAGARQ